jgi:hypothetical protein
MKRLRWQFASIPEITIITARRSAKIKSMLTLLECLDFDEVQAS